MTNHPLDALHDAFADLADPRIDRTKEQHLLDMVAIAICAVICGADRWVAIEEFGKATQAWLRTVLALPNGIPSHDTFGRVFAARAAAPCQHGFLRWIRAVWPATPSEVIAVDGKTLRGSHDRGSGNAAIQLVSAWAGPARLVLAQRKVDDTANEITAVPAVLRRLDLADCPVSVDALGCQTALATQIVQQGAAYVLAVKENQEQMYPAIVDTFRYAQNASWRAVLHAQYRTGEGGHGRIETRDDWVIHEPEVLAYLNPTGAWVDLTAIGMVLTERIIHGTPAYERRYYLLSGEPSAQSFAHAVRGHGGIENSVHWVLDVTLREDESRIRTGNAPQNVAV